jgi:polyisoprenoid-binding protein YceI
MMSIRPLRRLSSTPPLVDRALQRERAWGRACWTAFLACALLLIGRSTPAAEAQAQPSDPLVASVDSAASRIDYTGSAPLHDWTGTSRDVEGRLALAPEAPSESSVEIRVPVASFDSGNRRRDRKMREVTDAEAHPIVRFRASDIQPDVWGRGHDGQSGRWSVRGALTFHGQTHPVEADVDVQIRDGVLRARAQFPISLTRFGVERPSMAWIAAIDDTIRIDAQIVARLQDAPASASLEGKPGTAQ